MALIFTDGCDHISTITDKWDDSNGVSYAAGVQRRLGVNAISLNNATGSVNYVTKNISGTPTTITCGFAFYIQDATWTSHEGFKIVRSGSTQCSVRINNDRTVSVFRGTPSDTLLDTSTWAATVNVWYYMEFSFTVDDASGTYDVDINGQSILSGTGADTKNTATAGIDAVGLEGCLTATDSDIFICDLYMRDDLTRHGDCRVDKLTATGSGNYSQWTPSAGSNYQNIDDSLPDDDTTYNGSDTQDEIDTFTFDDISALGNTIHAVVINNVMRKTDIGARGVSALVRISSTDYTATENSVEDAYKCLQGIWETNPNTTSAWTESDVNALEAGYKLTT